MLDKKVEYKFKPFIKLQVKPQNIKYEKHEKFNLPFSGFIVNCKL